MTKTTYEMNGLLTQEDIDNRFFIMGECKNCGQWTKLDLSDHDFTCTYCEHKKYDMKGARSIRSWLTTKHLKVSKAGRKKNGA